MTIRTILFDLDGTLIDTNELIIQSFLHTLEKYYPGRYQREDVLPFIGPSLYETFSSLDPERVEEMVKTYRTFNHAHHDELIREFDTVYETIETLHRHGFRLGVVTTKMHDTALMGLRKRGWNRFSRASSASMTSHGQSRTPSPFIKRSSCYGQRQMKRSWSATTTTTFWLAKTPA